MFATVPLKKRTNKKSASRKRRQKTKPTLRGVIQNDDGIIINVPRGPRISYIGLKGGSRANACVNGTSFSTDRWKLHRRQRKHVFRDYGRENVKEKKNVRALLRRAVVGRVTLFRGIDNWIQTGPIVINYRFGKKKNVNVPIRDDSGRGTSCRRVRTSSIGYPRKKTGPAVGGVLRTAAAGRTPTAEGVVFSVAFRPDSFDRCRALHARRVAQVLILQSYTTYTELQGTRLATCCTVLKIPSVAKNAAVCDALCLFFTTT